MKYLAAALAALIVGLVGGVALTHAAPSLRGTKTVVREVPTPVPSPYPVVQKVIKRVRVPVYVTVSPSSNDAQYATLCYNAIENDLGQYPSNSAMAQCEATVAEGGAPP
jgi:hypothetical protein